MAVFLSIKFNYEIEYCIKANTAVNGSEQSKEKNQGYF